MNLVDFDINHLKSFESNYLDDDGVDLIKSRLEYQADNGIAFSAIEKGVPMAIGGVFTYWPGVGEAWSLINKKAEKKKIAVFKIVRSGLFIAMKAGNYHRIQSSCCVCLRDSRFLEMLGFKLQGILRQYNPDQSDAFLYEIVL